VCHYRYTSLIGLTHVSNQISVVQTIASIEVAVFWDDAPYSLVVGNQHFGDRAAFISRLNFAIMDMPPLHYYLPRRVLYMSP
jgi:hypothetical protein